MTGDEDQNQSPYVTFTPQSATWTGTAATISGSSISVGSIAVGSVDSAHVKVGDIRLNEYRDQVDAALLGVKQAADHAANLAANARLSAIEANNAAVNAQSSADSAMNEAMAAMHYSTMNRDAICDHERKLRNLWYVFGGAVVFDIVLAVGGYWLFG